MCFYEKVAFVKATVVARRVIAPSPCFYAHSRVGRVCKAARYSMGFASEARRCNL